VPDAFFKALLIHDGKEYRAVAYIMPNEGKHHPLRHYACSVDQLEELIGRDLFPALDDETEASVEASVKGID
jgi:DNA/RNA endonuclease G (NUC1)